MHGSALNSAGFLGSLLMAAIGGWNSQGKNVPMPQSKQFRPVVNQAVNGYELVAHHSEETTFDDGSVFGDWGVRIHANVVNRTGTEQVTVKCVLVWGGEVYACSGETVLPRGQTSEIVFDFPQPSYLATTWDSFLGGDPRHYWKLSFVEHPSKGWGVLTWVGCIAAGLCLTAMLVQHRRRLALPNSDRHQ